MFKILALAAATAMASASAEAQVSLGALSDRPASSMTPTEIKAHNQGLQANDPNFITCKRTEVTGSLARKLRVCRTQREWAAYSEQGSRTAQELADQVGRIAPQGN